LSNLILLPQENEYIDLDGVLRTTLPPGAINLAFPGIHPQLREQLLHVRHATNYMADALETGHLIMTASGNFIFHTDLPAESFVGFAMEAFVVRMLNSNPRLKRNALLWCSRKMQVKDDFLSQFTAIGTGLLATKQNHISLYEPQSKLDVKFIRPRHNKRTKQEYFDLLPQEGTHIPAGIQIKAITRNEKAEIVDKIISGEYSHVLTCCWSSERGGAHTKDVCMTILKDMLNASLLPYDEYLRALDAIKSPADLGFDQSDIDEYIRYLIANYPKVLSPNEFTDVVATLEITAQFSPPSHYLGERKILLPDEMNFQIED
jgi:hypothetical protein